MQSTFTSTYTNPSDKAMPNANLDLEIYGGQDNSPATAAKQLNLTYSTNGDAGPFKPVLAGRVDRQRRLHRGLDRPG